MHARPREFKRYEQNQHKKEVTYMEINLKLAKIDNT